jgi:hypothetical protein
LSPPDVFELLAGVLFEFLDKFAAGWMDALMGMARPFSLLAWSSLGFDDHLDSPCHAPSAGELR